MHSHYVDFGRSQRGFALFKGRSCSQSGSRCAACSLTFLFHGPFVSDITCRASASLRAASPWSNLRMPVRIWILTGGILPKVSGELAKRDKNLSFARGYFERSLCQTSLRGPKQAFRLRPLRRQPASFRAARAPRFFA